MWPVGREAGLQTGEAVGRNTHKQSEQLQRAIWERKVRTKPHLELAPR